MANDTTYREALEQLNSHLALIATKNRKMREDAEIAAKKAVAMGFARVSPFYRSPSQDEVFYQAYDELKAKTDYVLVPYSSVNGSPELFQPSDQDPIIITTDEKS